MRRSGHAVFRASIDAFQRPRAEREARGEHDPLGYYEDAFDYDQLRRVLIEPFRMAGGAGFTTAAFDRRRDTPLELQWQSGPHDATLIVDGVFVNRPELRGIWNSSIWLDVDREAADERLRDSAGQVSPRFRGAQALYAAQADPRDLATTVVDDTDPQFPRRVFLDRC
jgi:uridine kinase